MAKRHKVSARTGWTLAVTLGLLLILFALVIGPWLFTRYPQKNLTAEQELKAKNDVRTTLVQTLAGLAVTGGLIVTYRTYRQNQVEQERNYQQRHDEQQQRQLEQDRTYERELYATALEQLGHDQAPVRLGALYSLESLAQDRPDRRQMVVDVLCAYLRMPYPPPSQQRRHPRPRRRSTASMPAQDPAQELQVRQTAQRLLATHLYPPRNTSTKDAQRLPSTPEQTFWPDIRIDLTGATLVEFDFSKVSLVRANFSDATFSGDAWFFGAIFSGGAGFNKATFTGDAWFSRATFTGDAFFGGATFSGRAFFGGATFSGTASFLGATFTRASFSEATFNDSSFGEATFKRPADFGEATFTGGANFGRATFSGRAFFGRAKVLHLDLRKRRSWPPGWIVRPDPDDPTHGELTKADQAD